MDGIKNDNKKQSLMGTGDELSAIKPIQFTLFEKFAWIKTYFHSKKTPVNRYMTPREQAIMKSK